MIHDEAQLEALLSEPSEKLVEALSHVDGDLIVLGAGGKMGPTLARMARRASDPSGSVRRIYAVSRFSDKAVEQRLTDWGVETLAGDLLRADFVDTLPEAPNVIYLVGTKFGTQGAEPRTWAANAYLPGAVCQKFHRSRIVALSTGNVYGMVSTDSQGAVESDAPIPIGEYAMSALGRERVFEFFSRQHDIPMALIRLNYATELRYGVLVDLAQKVQSEEPISLAMGYVNLIWQADASDMILRSLQHVANPPLVLNVTGMQKLSCRQLAVRLGELLGKRVEFQGVESPDALLSNAIRAAELFGPPRTTLDEMLARTADWVARGQPLWNKPTHFEVRDGKF